MSAADVTRENYFDVAEAIHCWLTLNHEGQFSLNYKLLCRSQFRPGPLWTESRCERENEYLAEINQANVEELLYAVEKMLLTT